MIQNNESKTDLERHISSFSFINKSLYIAAILQPKPVGGDEDTGRGHGSGSTRTWNIVYMMQLSDRLLVYSATRKMLRPHLFRCSSSCKSVVGGKLVHFCHNGFQGGKRSREQRCGTSEESKPHSVFSLAVQLEPEPPFHTGDITKGKTENHVTKETRNTALAAAPEHPTWLQSKRPFRGLEARQCLHQSCPTWCPPGIAQLQHPFIPDHRPGWLGLQNIWSSLGWEAWFSSSVLSTVTSNTKI